MNNLEMIQEATLVYGQPGDFSEQIGCNFPHIIESIQPPRPSQPFWTVWILGDELEYEFDTMAEALDFACDEARLAATVH